MAVVNVNDDTELRRRLDVDPDGSQRRPGEIWLDGNVILCACPDCKAPMSVRFWLMMADCWRCGTTIELSEEQERQVEQLLAHREPPALVSPPPTPPPIQPPRPNLVPESRRGRDDRDAPGASLLPAAVERAEPHEPWSRHLLNETPAWLISMLVHLIVFTLLALLTME